MRITDIKATLVTYAMPYNLRWGRYNRDDVGGTILQVFTDEGITGIGISNAPYHIVRTIVDRTLLPCLRGQNPLDIQRIWDMVHSLSGADNASQVVGGIDIALWDILGKATGQPVFRLLGAVRDRIPVYIAPSMKQPEIIIQECEEYKAAGYLAIKLRIGLGVVGLDEPKSIAKDLRIIESARKILGDGVDIGADTDKTYDHFTTLRVAPALEAIGAAWLEEPLDVRDREQYVRAMARLQSQVKVPLSGGQGFFSHYQYGEIVAQRAIDIVQPDVVRVGGISELKRVADLASAWGLSCMPHIHCGAGHDIQLLATAHCMAAMTNAMYLCYPAYDTPLRTELSVDQPRVVNGYLTLPDKPGLGIELNEDVLLRYSDPAYAYA